MHYVRFAMAITTAVRPSYFLRGIILGLLMLVLGVWGIYDLLVSIPAAQARVDRFTEARARLAELDQLGLAGGPESLTQEQIAEYAALEAETDELAPGGENPVPPGKWDKAVQWMFILCLPFVPLYMVGPIRTRGHQYTIENDGALRGPHGTWAEVDIASIDMSRWMSKSVAAVVHTDGRRVDLDDFIHRDMDKIVGAIAHRMHPDQWDEDAKPVKSEAASAEEQPVAPDAGGSDSTA